MNELIFMDPLPVTVTSVVTVSRFRSRSTDEAGTFQKDEVNPDPTKKKIVRMNKKMFKIQRTLTEKEKVEICDSPSKVSLDLIWGRLNYTDLACCHMIALDFVYIRE